MPTSPITETERRVECWVRSLARVPDGPQGRVVRRLEWLATDGRLDTLEVETWPATVPTDRERLLGSHERTVHERLETFEDWADRRDRDLGPGFEERGVGHTALDAPVEQVRTLPAVALAEYREGELVRVTPSSDERGVDSVDAHLQDLLSRPPKHSAEVERAGTVSGD
ncbi:hypothetical protein N0B31_11270 [Salinirubellus salinus]|uniref:Uncharacterized protein n=1 Tax=Salinirubellus salinus TaxID=1364945 RepID=A0A9E7QZ67_9EURY|nr:HTH domain-containing protein [Salinirubellus salinus]UWM52731.1 hypothetical protein N0B31_11270 [Salinirubellus salinus]